MVILRAVGVARAGTARGRGGSVRPLVAEVRSGLLPGPRQLRDALERRRFDYLQLMLELPDLLLESSSRNCAAAD
jgi:hypothetical protein